MKQEKQYIEELLRKFLEGQTSESEEQTLSDYFCSAKDIPAEWQKYKEMFQSFKTDAYDFSEEEIDAMLAPAVEKKTKVVRIWPWAAAACAAGLLMIVLTPPKEGTIQIAKIEEVKPKQSEPIEQETPVLAQEVSAVDRKAEPASVAKAKGKTATKAISTTNMIAKVERKEETPQPTETTSEPVKATEDIFDATLAHVRRAAMEKMMSCDMQCMNEDINLRANHLSTLMYEQNQ